MNVDIEKRYNEFLRLLKHAEYPDGYTKNQKRTLRKSAESYVVGEG